MASIRQFLSSLSPSKATVKAKSSPPSPERHSKDSDQEHAAAPPGSGDFLRLCLGFKRWRESRASLLTLPSELRDIIFGYVLGDDTGKVKHVAYGHIEVQLDIDCALAYTCMSLRREFHAHVHRKLSDSLRLANQTMIIYPFKTDDWAETLADGLCTSCNPSSYIRLRIGHFTTLKLCEGVPVALEEDNMSTIFFLDVRVWYLRARISPCRCIQRRDSSKRCVSECAQLQRKPSVMQRLSSWTTGSPKSRSVSSPAKYQISAPLSPCPKGNLRILGTQTSETHRQVSVIDVLDYYYSSRSSACSIPREAETPESNRLSTVAESCRNSVIV